MHSAYLISKKVFVIIKWSQRHDWQYIKNIVSENLRDNIPQILHNLLLLIHIHEFLQFSMTFFLKISIIVCSQSYYISNRSFKTNLYNMNSLWINVRLLWVLQNFLTPHSATFIFLVQLMSTFKINFIHADSSLFLVLSSSPEGRSCGNTTNNSQRLPELKGTSTTWKSSNRN